MAEAGSYDGTIRSLYERRAVLLAEVEKLDEAIAILQSMANPGSHFPTPTPTPTHKSQPVGIYSHISLRWACLWILSKAPANGMSSAAITEEIVRGGRTSTAGKFSSSISGVLSIMKTKGEVDQIGTHWFLTQTGKSAFQAILPRLKLLEEQAI